LYVADRLLICPHCQGRELIRKGKRFWRLQTVPIGPKQLWLVTEVSALPRLGWDTVKEIVQKQLRHDYGQPRSKELKYLAIDEIYVGKGKKSHTLVLDLEMGQIVRVGHGRGRWP